MEQIETMNTRITGVVTYSKRTPVSGEWIHKFRVRNDEDQEQYSFDPKEFCIAELGDIFSCECSCIGRNATMEGKPFVKVYNDDKSLKYHLVKLLPKGPWKIRKDLSDKL